MRCPRRAIALATTLTMALAMVIPPERGLCPNRGDWGLGAGGLLTPPSKILAKISPECGFWKGPGLTVDTPIEDPG